MSGGHWDYQQWKIGEWADKAYQALDAIGEIEHLLDWGYSGDTCRTCAEIQTIKILCDLFDGWAGNRAGHTWGDRSIWCDNCREWHDKHPPKEKE